ncbi:MULTISPECIES: hypothetical protein [Enterobacterales]|uniref:DUF1380 domain-containing protein n=6 Tax=Enterobacterales TaxID=91347 RepID=A0A7L8KAH9_ECOLX|nr:MULTISPECIES: hypothetical protein [Enterobacterales]ELY4881610.1 hypothetical protein [Morganella morganii]QOE89799.1 hypothetical protein [Escherichia coli]SPY66721.1 Uncharacterised protein [Providencia stuartii]BAB93860.1 hypothetical protein [Proteus vulgaris]ALV81853.1 hypothetical protein AOY08_100138 [Providencia rettgeri]
MYGTVKEIIAHLSQYKNQDEQIGTIIWHSDDVKAAVQDFNNEEISDEIARDALKHAISSHDANYGITHETLVCAAEFVIEERKKA